MSEPAVIAAGDPILESDCAKEMVRQMRAIDTYGTYDSWPVERILRPFVVTKIEKREIPVVGDPDEIVLSRVRAFYNAISALIEKRTGLMAIPMIHLTHEGFGRAIVTVGKLVAVDRTLRDVHRFGFPDLSKMKHQMDELVAKAVDAVEKYPEAARE